MTQSITRRPRKGADPVAVDHFRDHVDKALEAFRADVTYSVLMARAAVTIARKRQVWQNRRQLRDVV